MSPEQLLESLDRHFAAGCPTLSTKQLLQHWARGTCLECERLAAVAADAAMQERAVTRC